MARTIEKASLMAIHTRIRKRELQVKALEEEIELMKEDLKDKIGLWIPPNSRPSLIEPARQELRDKFGLK